MKVLLTGIRGEIGQQIARYLDRLGVPYEPFSLDVTYPAGCRIWHLAAKKSDAAVKDILATNLDYLHQVLTRSEELAVSEFVFFSTNSIYAKSVSGEICEHTPKDVESFYSLTKILGEQLVANAHGIPLRLCLRLPGFLETKKLTTFISKSLHAILSGHELHFTFSRAPFNHAVSPIDLVDFLLSPQLRKKQGYYALNYAHPSSHNLRDILCDFREQVKSTSRLQWSEIDSPGAWINTDYLQREFAPNLDSLSQSIWRWYQLQMQMRSL